MDGTLVYLDVDWTAFKDEKGNRDIMECLDLLERYELENISDFKVNEKILELVKKLENKKLLLIHEPKKNSMLVPVSLAPGFKVIRFFFVFNTSELNSTTFVLQLRRIFREIKAKSIHTIGTCEVRDKCSYEGYAEINEDEIE